MYILDYSIPELKEMIESLSKEIVNELDEEEKDKLIGLKEVFIEQLEYWENN